jgi:hypothetical protein
LKLLIPKKTCELIIKSGNDNKAYYQLENSVSINVVKAVAQEAIIKTLYCTQERTDKSKPTLAQSLNYVPDPNGRGSAMPFPCA